MASIITGDGGSAIGGDNAVSVGTVRQLDEVIGQHPPVCPQTYIVRYFCGETEEDAQVADSLDDAHRLVALKASNMHCQSEVVIIFRVSPSGTEELEESRKLRA